MCTLKLIFCLNGSSHGLGLSRSSFAPGIGLVFTPAQLSSAFQFSSGIAVRVFVGLCGRPGALSVCSSGVKSVMSGMIYSLLQDQCSGECDPHALR